MSIAIVLQQMGVIAILVSIGIYLYKKEIVDNITSQKISAIVMDVCNPALILASILSGNISASHEDLMVAMILGVIFYIGLVFFGLLLPLILRVEKKNRNSGCKGNPS